MDTNLIISAGNAAIRLLDNIVNVFLQRKQLELKLTEINAKTRIELAEQKVRLQQLRNDHKEKLELIKSYKKQYYSNLKIISQNALSARANIDAYNTLLKKLTPLLVSNDPQERKEALEIFKITNEQINHYSANLNELSSNLLQFNNNNRPKQLTYNNEY